MRILTKFAFGTVAVFGYTPSVCRAQVITDGTLGPARVLEGPNIEIEAELGTRRGSNLFHSFEQFGIDAGERATFSGPDEIGRIISRVTGGDVSRIDGTLRSTVPDADVYLINPAGVIFGPDAELDVQGAVAVTTADEITFPDGGIFSASDPQTSLLSAAPPEAFGFLGQQPPAVVTIESADLTISPGADLTIVGGEITVAGPGGDVRDVPVDEARSVITAPGGDVRMAAVEGAARVALDPFAISSSEALGPITLSDTYFELSADTAGGIDLMAGDLRIENSWILANTGDGNGAGLRFEGETITFDASIGRTDGRRSGEQQTRIVSFSQGLGRSGDIQLIGGEIALLTGADIVIQENSLGSSGDIAISGNSLTMTGTSRLVSFAYSPLPGGNIDISLAGTLRLDGQNTDRQVRIDSIGYNAGTGGSISVSAANITMINRSRIFSAAQGSGRGGDITVNAHSIGVGKPLPEPTFFENGITASTVGTGRGGDVTIFAERADFFDGTLVSTYSFAAGDAGTFTLQGGYINFVAESGDTFTASAAFAEGAPGDAYFIADHLRMDGNLVEDGAFPKIRFIQINTAAPDPGDLHFDVGWLEMIDDAQIESVTEESGPDIENRPIAPGPDIFITADRLTITEPVDTPNVFAGGFQDIGTSANGTVPDENGSTRYSSTPGPVGQSGDITINAGEIILTGPFVGIGTQNRRVSNQIGGTLTINADRLEVLEGAYVNSFNVQSLERGGDLFIDANTIRIANENGPRSSSISSGAGPYRSTDVGQLDQPLGDAGNLTITAGRIELSGGIIESSSGGASSSGAVNVTAGEIVAVGDGVIRSIDELNDFGPDGMPAIETGIFSNTPAVVGQNGGSITIDTGSLSLTQGALVVSAIEGDGRGGDIDVTADRLTISSGGRVDAGTLASGDGGDISITVSERVALDGQRSGFSVESFSTRPDAGDAGNVTVTAPELTLRNGAEITTRTGFADGGNIALEIGALVLLRESAITTSVGGGNGFGGDIEIGRPGFTVLDASDLRADAVFGNGGNITIATDNLVPSFDSVISASSEFAVDGEITLLAPEIDFSNIAVQLPDNLLDVTDRLAAQCGARGSEARATFTGRGASALPPQPVDAITLDYDNPGAQVGAGFQAGMILLDCK